jgi:putative flippase GtrA
MKQLPRFIIVGVFNTMIDLGVLSALVFAFGLGWSVFAYATYKLVSFLIASTNSYVWNRFWVFRGPRVKNTMGSVSTFFLISAAGLLVNTLVSTAVFSFVAHSSITLPTIILVNVAALFGTVVVLVWNFFGYKFLVFKETPHETLFEEVVMNEYEP